MKNYFVAYALTFGCLLTALVIGCKKESLNTYNGGEVSNSFIEEFENFASITESKGWITKNDVSPDSLGIFANWGQGSGIATDKSGAVYGFPAYSYKSSNDEYAYSGLYYSSFNAYSISSWLITPVLDIKNGDQISFYTRGDDPSSFQDRMQVLANNSTSDNTGNEFGEVGDFTTTLFDINQDQNPNGYPTKWTLYTYTFLGIPDKTKTRIAFRHYMNNVRSSQGVAIDQFTFESK